MVEVATFQCPNAGDQATQGPRECMGDKEDQSASHQNCRQAEQYQVAIQLIQKFCGLIVRLEDAETNRSRLRAGQIQRSRQEAFVANLNIVRRFLRRTGNESLEASTLHLRSWQSCRNYFIPAGKSDRPACHLAYLTSETAIDFKADPQKSQ